MGFVLNGNGNRDVNIPEGMSGAEVERRLNQPVCHVSSTNLSRSSAFLLEWENIPICQEQENNKFPYQSFPQYGLWSE